MEMDDFNNWEIDYSIGISEIDNQHKEIIMLVKELLKICNDTKKENQRKDFLELFLAGEKYVKVHFSTEEEYMSAQKYPKYEGHKERHDKMLEDTKEMEIKIMNRKKTLMDGVIFLREWVEEHINSIDKNMGEYLYSKKQNHETGI